MDYDAICRTGGISREIARYPHGSANEAPVIISCLCKRNLECMQDELYNVIIRKPATAGNEDAPVLPFAHMDMVCERTSTRCTTSKGSIRFVYPTASSGGRNHPGR